MHHTATKGNVGVAFVVADLLERGWDVLEPVCGTSPFDLVAYRAGEFRRIQVKYRTTSAGGTLDVQLRRASITAKRVKWSPNTEVDWAAIYCPETRLVYYVPAAHCPIRLRLAATKNRQKIGVRLAEAYKSF